MAEKKVTVKKTAAVKKTAPKKTTTPEKVATPKKAAIKTAGIPIGPESVGFWAGDVYQALASEEKSLTVEEIGNIANIGIAEVLLGMGWLFKEGKIIDDDNKIAIA